MWTQQVRDATARRSPGRLRGESMRPDTNGRIDWTGVPAERGVAGVRTHPGLLRYAGRRLRLQPDPWPVRRVRSAGAGRGRRPALAWNQRAGTRIVHGVLHLRVATRSCGLRVCVAPVVQRRTDESHGASGGHPEAGGSGNPCHLEGG